MPLNRAAALLKSMYRSDPQISDKFGYVRLGGRPKWKDPFIDLKMFSLMVPGTENAIFGADFERDIGHRDFSCNAIYYDPINAVLIDPSGRGITDATEMCLHLVSDARLRGAVQRAQIVIRFVKFMTRGFKPSIVTTETIRKDYMPDLSAMDGGERLRYFKAQIINKCSPSEREASLDRFRETMIAFGAEVEWNDFFEPLKEDFLS